MMPDESTPGSVPDPLMDLDNLQTIAGLRAGDLVIGRFKLERCLGRGGMGEVWLAHDQMLDEPLALKLLPRLIHFDERAVEDLKNETRRGRQLSHPHIVRVFDFYQDSQNVAIAMEFVDGENLAVLQAREPQGVFSAARIAPWVTHLLQGLDYAHRNNEVVHRDLKPANLLIDSKMQVLKIADFGIARCLADSMQRATLSAQSRGTLCYMSPEQTMGRGANPLDDLYAVGATLYELLAGTPPFYQGDLFNQILKVPPAPLAERQREQGFSVPVPREWEDVIMSCLAKERALRPQSAAEIVERLGLGSGQSAVAYPSLKGAVGPTAGTQESPASRPSPHGPATTTPLVSGATGSIEVSTTASVRTVPMVTKRSFDFTRTTRTGENTEPVSVPRDSTGKARPKKSLWVGTGIAALLATTGGIGWWQWSQNRKPAVPPLPVTGVTVTLGRAQVVLPKAAPTGDWRVPGDFPTLQAALTAVTKSGQKILLGPETFTGQIILTVPVHLVGSGREQTIFTVDGQSGSVLEIRSCQGVTIEGIGLKHSGDQGLLGEGAPVVKVSDSAVALKNCRISDGFDSGLLLSGGSATAEGCLFEMNTRYGIKVTSGTAAGSILTALECQFANNMTGANLELAGSSAIFTRCKFSDHTDYGVEVSDQAAAKLEKCELTANLSAGVFANDPGTEVSLTECQVSGSREAAGILAEAGADLDVAGSVIQHCKNGVSILNAGDVMIGPGCVLAHHIHGLALVAATDKTGKTGSIQVLENKILNNSGIGILVEGQGMAPGISNNIVGPNAQLDILVRYGAGGVYRGNKLLSPLKTGETLNYEISREAPVDWHPDNQVTPLR